MPKFAANLTMLFAEQPFLDRFAAAKAAGFSGVEYLFPYDFDKADLREQLHQHGLTQVLHNLPAGNWGAGERGIAILPDRVEEFRDGVARAIDYAKALDCRQLNCLVGIAPDGVDRVDLNEVLVGNLRFAADALAREGIKLLIEPINTIDIPGFFLNKTAQALQIIADVRSNNLFVQYDIYHMQIMEGDIARTLQKHLPRIAHVPQPPRGILLEQPAQHARERPRGLRQRLPIRFVPQHARQRGRRVLSAKGPSSGEHFVDHTAERPHIAAGVRGVALRLLRTHIGSRPDDHALFGHQRR